MRKLLRSLAGIVASGFGTGYSPFAPGTAGSILAAALFYLVRSGMGTEAVWVVLPVLVGLAFWSCRVTEPHWGHDSSRMTVDEMAGCWVACLSSPVAWGLWGLAGSMVLFRLLDILKPWPVSYLDELDRPAAVVLDDLAAGALAALPALLWRLV